MQSQNPIDFHKPDSSPKRDNEKVRPIEYGLVAVIAGAIGVMAVPDFKPVPTDMRGMAQYTQFQYKLDNYRDVLETYRAEHDTYPGFIPGTESGDLDAPVSELHLRYQLLLGSSEAGYFHAVNPIDFPLGPYFETGMTKNPVNGLDSVQLLANDEPFPVEPNGQTGWLYKPATGEIRANSLGGLSLLKKNFYDM